MGEWVDTPRAWYDISVLNCSLCGKMLPGKTWSVDIAGQARIFCDPDCEDAYRDYWLPRYGADAISRANASMTQCVESHPGPLPGEHVEKDVSVRGAMQGSEEP